MLFKAHFDESADQPETIFTVGGFVGPERAWTDLEPKWLAAIPDKVGYFHATACLGGRNNFRGVPIHERETLLDTLTELIIGADIQLVAAGIKVEAFAKFAPKLKQNDFGGNKYVAPFGFAIELACKDYMNLGKPLPTVTGDACALYVEDGPWKPGAAIAVRGMKGLPHDRWWRDRIGTDTYGSKKPGTADYIPLLQVADYGAFLANKHFTGAVDGPIPWRPYYDKLEKARKIFGLLRIDEASLKVFYGIYQITKLSVSEMDELWNTTSPGEPE